MFLDTENFSKVIQSTPLTSIDLLVQNGTGKILLGKRTNEPVKDFWFVPGGRVFKDETLDEAFQRITQDELGTRLTRDSSSFYGLYEHFYTNNVYNADFSTHYIVLSHILKLTEDIKTNNQHSEYRWFSKKELLSSTHVHQYTKNYFQGKKI